MSSAMSYLCHGVNDNLPGGKASGELTVYQMAIECNILGHRRHMPLTGLQITMGGAGDRLVLLTHPSLPDWSFYTSDRSILKNPVLHGQKTLQQPLRKAQRVRLLNGMALAAAALAIVVLPLAVFFKADDISHIIARQVPLEWERQLGETAYSQLLASTRQMEATVADALLQPMTVYLEQALVDNPYALTFTIIDNAELNAFALPGGYIVIHSALILRAESAQELLGVLAHEIAHVTEQHGIRNMIAGAGTLAIVTALLGDLSGISGVIAAAAPLLINQRYSRDFEREADDIGYTLLVDADINPQGLTRFFEKILAEEEAALANANDRELRGMPIDTMVFLRSHPSTRERIRRLQHRAIDQSRHFRDLSAEFKRLQLATEQFAAGQTVEEIDDGSEH